jgi:hypothetical protein
MSLLKDTFVYFAKFPDRTGVLRSFNRETSTYTGYDAFKAEINALTVHSLIPGILDYIFGIDEATVLKKINEVKGRYMFIDYGAVTISRDNVNRQYHEFQLAVTVAEPIDTESIDFAEEVLLGDEMLANIKVIRDRMLADQREIPWLKDLTFPNEITPVFMRELNNSVGWTMMFRKAGYDLL